MFVIFILILCSSLINCEYYTSVEGLEELIKIEQILLSDLQDFQYFLNNKNKVLENVISKIKIEHESAQKDIEDYLTNPINVFKLIKRLYNDWWKYTEYVDNDKEFQGQLDIRYKQLAFPSYSDFKESSLALMRIRNTYNLNVSDMASGILNGIKYGSKMSWSDCLFMAHQMLNVGEFHQTKLWVKEFLKNFNEEEKTSLDLEKHIRKTLINFGDIDVTLNIFKTIIEEDDIQFQNLTKFYTNEYLQSEKYAEEQGYHSTEDFKLYEKVCREEITRSPHEVRDLHCRFYWGECSFCRLAPFKLEEINFDPVISIFHNMIGEKEMDFIKEFARPAMKCSKVLDNFSGHSKRISKNAWLPYDWHPSVWKLLRNLEDATGLNMRDSEKMQVANYGIGGYYEPHFEFYVNVIDEVQTNRLSTSILYLSDVEQGGATAFPLLKIAVKPSKGDVLFWYNLHYSLEFDFRTLHAGCPVIKGSKWIGNVCNPDYYQFDRRPCLLYRDNVHPLPQINYG